jgi:hypothetical protein
MQLTLDGCEFKKAGKNSESDFIVEAIVETMGMRQANECQH